jgi:hypothetical protein
MTGVTHGSSGPIFALRRSTEHLPEHTKLAGPCPHNSGTTVTAVTLVGAGSHGLSLQSGAMLQLHSICRKELRK